MRRSSNCFLAIGVFLLLGCVLPAWANISISNIKLNGRTNSAIVLPDQEVTISYILNEPATQGSVTLDIFQRNNLIRSISAAWPNPGTLRGTNVVVWDGQDKNGKAIAQGVYTVSITASTAGYDSWTKISDDNNPGNKIYDPYGIAVNKNTNSFFYGRVFVGNAMSTTSIGNGIYKFNADCSDADEGSFGPSSYVWDGHMTSPWKLDVSQDDRVYVNDWRSYGTVLAFDQTISSYSIVLNDSNWLVHSNGDFANLSGPFVFGAGADTKLWMADVNTPSSGITRWNVSAEGTVAQGDRGTCVVTAGSDSDLSQAPFDVSVGADGSIYVVQRIYDVADPAPRVLCFQAPSADFPSTNAIWKAGTGAGSLDTNAPFTSRALTNLDNAYGISVDETGSYVAIAVRGVDRQNGGLVILNAATGNLVTNLDSGPLSSYMDVAWDRVGNVYGTQEELWSVFSPPGANQSTTAALNLIQKLDALTQPVLGLPELIGGKLRITLHGQENVTYTVQSSAELEVWTDIATTSTSSPDRTIEVTPPEACSFYRALISP